MAHPRAAGDTFRGLVAANTPPAFWRLAEPQPVPADWAAAVRLAAARLPEPLRWAAGDLETLLHLTLGEGQFGPDHWRVRRAQRIYYTLKPAVPRPVRRLLRRLRGYPPGASFPLGWPVEDRYAQFLWEVARQLPRVTGRPTLPFIHFWPQGWPYAVVLTHDVETADGQERVLELAELDARHGFRSSFNFVLERYPIDRGLVRELRARGFEIGGHGLRHDGKLFFSHAEFQRRAERINRQLRTLEAVGFRAPLTHRHPGWMQALDIEYDLSFFDTDPFEPIPGGTMSLWPFALGRFTELPYTLVQDYTLTAVLRETTPRLWLQKVDAIRTYSGMVLLNTHPDYLSDRTTRRVYTEFLDALRQRADFWHALPADVARWWKARGHVARPSDLPGAVLGRIDESGVHGPQFGGGLAMPGEPGQTLATLAMPSERPRRRQA